MILVAELDCSLFVMFQMLSQTTLLICVSYCFLNLTCFGRLFDDR